MRISVALNAYDASSDLPGLLDALAAQTTLPYELIAHDDRSADDTFDLLEAFAARAPFPVIVRRNDRRYGPIEGAEMTFRAASGDVIAVHDQADVWRPEKIERIASMFSGEVGLVFSDGEFEHTTLWRAAGYSARDVAQLTTHPFVSAGTIAFATRLRDLYLPIPHHVSLDMWLASLGALAGPYIALDEQLLRRRHGTVAAPTGGAFDAARSKMRSTDADLHRQRRRAQAAAFASIVERYETQRSSSELTRELTERIVHLEARGKLPDARLQRLPIIVRELRSGRYNRYSAGVLSALQDLIY